MKERAYSSLLGVNGWCVDVIVILLVFSIISITGHVVLVFQWLSLIQFKIVLLTYALQKLTLSYSIHASKSRSFTIPSHLVLNKDQIINKTLHYSFYWIASVDS